MALEKEEHFGWEGLGVLKRKKTVVGRVRVSRWGWSRVDGHGAVEKEQDS